MSAVRVRLIPIVLLLLVLIGEADGRRPANEYKFDSPSVLFLGTNRPNTVHPRSHPVQHVLLPRDAALAIVSAPDLDWDSPEVLSYGANTEKERSLISVEKQGVRRAGKRLTITPALGSPVAFTNWSDPGGPQREGDGAKYFYAGRFGRLKYYRVEDRLEHDSPGSYLINPANGKMAYAHQGDDIVALSPDGIHLLVFNPLNLQEDRALTVVSLSVEGPTIDLRCVFNRRNPYDVSMSFKGWHNPDSFDIVFNFKESSAEPIPVRIELGRQGYVVAVPDRLRLEKEIGFMCGR
ncbi:MAG: hypothetical protein ACLPX5_00245 [Dissulfurispiraceae bacterium]